MRRSRQKIRFGPCFGRTRSASPKIAMTDASRMPKALQDELRALPGNDVRMLVIHLLGAALAG